MITNPIVREAYVAWCQAEINERYSALIPFETGAMRTAERGVRTGYRWVDTTLIEAAKLKQEIANFESEIAAHSEAL